MHVALGYWWYPAGIGYHLERALRQIGHTTIYVGLPSDQRPGYDSSVSLTEVIARLDPLPDLYLWIDPANRYFPPGIESLSIPTACYLIDVHLGHWREQAARFFDAVFIAQHDYVDHFKSAVGHDQVYWLPLAAAPDVHRHADADQPRTFDVGFVGNLALAHQKTARARRLQLIAQHFKTNDFYRQYTPAEVGEIYGRSKIVFNTSIAGDVTMRVFEGTACGALLLTDSIANGLDQLFEVGKEIVVYQDDADLLDKIAYYLAHADERERMAQAGQQRTWQAHLYTHRVQRILETCTTSVFQRRAPMRQADPAARVKARLDVYTHLHMLDAVFDLTRAAGYHPLHRAWAALPCLARRVLM